MNKIKPSKANLSMRYLSLFSVVFVPCIKWIPVAFLRNMLFIYSLCSDNHFAKLPFCFLLHSITYTIFCLIVHWLCNFPSEFNTFSLFPFHNLGTWWHGLLNFVTPFLTFFGQELGGDACALNEYFPMFFFLLKAVSGDSGKTLFGHHSIVL